MRSPWLRTIALWGCLVTVCGLAPCRAAAQDPPRRNGNEPSPSTTESPVKEVQPPVLLLRNQSGDRLQAVLGFTLEDFERFIAQRAQLGLGQQPPRFQLERLSGQGTVHDRHADLQLELTISVNHTGWVRVPLRLAEGALRNKPSYEGPGEHRVEFDTTNAEYALWLKGQESPHKVKLELAVPLEKNADQTELKLGMPRAAVSELVLRVADPQAEATIRKGGILDATEHGKEDTKFTILGMERDFAVAWRKQSTQPAEAPAPLEASGIVDVRIDRNTVHADVQLTVRSFAPRLDTFRLRLPTGTTLTAADQSAYSIDPLDNLAAAEGQDAQIYEVRLREKATGPVQIRFATDAEVDEQEQGPKFALASFELIGAARQSGYVVVRVADDWQVEWDALKQARQIEEPPIDLDREGALAAFEYFSQPFSIEGHLSPLKTHLSVEPRYSVLVTPQQLRLEARLGYQIRGAKAFALQIDMAGWELDDVGPRSLLDVDRVSTEAGRPVRLPLLQPTTGAAEIVIQAHRALAADATQIAFDLPRPLADALAPSQVIVAPAENVSLSVRDADLVGLVRARTADNAVSAQATNNRALVFHGQQPLQHFQADLLLETRAVTAGISSLLRVEPSGAKLEETIAFDISYEPLSELLLEVPSWLATSDRIEWELEGQSVSPTRTDRESPVEGVTLFQLPLAEKRLGKFSLVVRYPLRFDPLTPDTETPIDVPLIIPAATELLSNAVLIRGPSSLSIEQRDAVWMQDKTEDPAESPSWRFSHGGASNELALRARLRSEVTVGPTIIERAWLQTRLAAGERWDRAVYNFSTHARRLTLRLPPGAIAGEAQLLLDGQSLTSLSPAREVIALDLPAEPAQHVLDVSYRFATRIDQRGALSFVPPTFGDNPWVRQTYWQLILPRDEHLLNWSDDLTAAYSWQFHRGLWTRQPAVEQPQLEAWVHATTGPDVPLQTSRYVLTSLGPIEQLQVYTISRALLMLIIAGGVLAAGLLLMYFKPLRQPISIFCLGIALATLVLLYPETALFMGQIAGLGAGLVLVAWAIERFFAARHRPPLVVRSTPSAIHEPGSTRTHLRTQASPSAAEGGTLVSQSLGSAGDS